jgi:hypothetical protein
MARSVTDIQADLDAAYAARRTALSAQSYSLDTGQGKQQVQRANLSDINKTIRELEAERDSAVADASGESGILAGNFQRY